jgi:hypothetical protein
MQIRPDQANSFVIRNETTGQNSMSIGSDGVTTTQDLEVNGFIKPNAITDLQPLDSNTRIYTQAGVGALYDSYSHNFRIGSSGSTVGMRISNNGTVLIGTPSTVGAGSEGIQLTGTAGYLSTARNSTTSASHHIFYNPNGIVGSIATANSATTYGTSSDYRLKENVAPMSNSIDRLKQLKPSTWSWIQDGSHGEGFLAHEAQTVVPECAIGTKDAMKTEEYEVIPAVLGDEDNAVTEAVIGTREVPDYQLIDQSKLVPLLTSALQEAIQRIEALEAILTKLEARIK